MLVMNFIESMTKNFIIKMKYILHIMNYFFRYFFIYVIFTINVIDVISVLQDLINRFATSEMLYYDRSQHFEN